MSSHSRVVSQRQLPDLRDLHKNERIVLASGCFDLIHRGHLFFLGEAAARGDVLVVGLNDDASVRALKGCGRPVMPAGDRCAVVAGLRWVDYVFTFSERCAGTSLELLRPDVFAVGIESVGLYPDEIAAAEAVGARVHQVANTPAPSTTRIIRGVRENA